MVSSTNNKLVQYIHDPYTDCVMDVSTDFKRKKYEHMLQMEENYKRWYSLKNTSEMSIFEIANEKEHIDNFFERKHHYCTHAKKTNWDRVKAQFRNLW
jgi:hypothetical protein